MKSTKVIQITRQKKKFIISHSDNAISNSSEHCEHYDHHGRSQHLKHYWHYRHFESEICALFLRSNELNHKNNWEKSEETKKSHHKVDRRRRIIIIIFYDRGLLLLQLCHNHISFKNTNSFFSSSNSLPDLIRYSRKLKNWKSENW